MFSYEGIASGKMKALLDRIILHLKSRKRQKQVNSGQLGPITSSSSAVSFLSDNTDSSTSENAQSNQFRQVNLSFSSACAKQKIPDDTQEPHDLVVNGNTLSLTESVKDLIEITTDLISKQHADIKQHFEIHTMEITKEIKNLELQLDETKGRCIKTDQRIDEMKNEAKLQHGEIRRRFESVESTVNKS